MKQKTTPPFRLAWTIWGWGAAFYLVGFFLRVTPAVMTAELMQAFQISATALGNLSTFYFYSYVAMLSFVLLFFTRETYGRQQR